MSERCIVQRSRLARYKALTRSDRPSVFQVRSSTRNCNHANWCTLFGLANIFGRVLGEQFLIRESIPFVSTSSDERFALAAHYVPLPYGWFVRFQNRASSS